MGDDDRREIEARRAELKAQFNPNPFVIPGEVTAPEVSDLKAAFDMIDDDASGKIDAQELKGAAVALGIPMEDNIEVLLGPEKIDFANFFARMTSKLTPEDKVDDIVNIFELFDQDHSGTISIENLQDVQRLIGAKETVKEIQDMMRLLDSDGDNALDPSDFYICLINGMRLRMDEENRRKERQAKAIHGEMRSIEGGSSGSGGLQRSMSGTSRNPKMGASQAPQPGQAAGSSGAPSTGANPNQGLK